MRPSFITLLLSGLSLTLSVVSKPQFLSRRDRSRPLPDVLTSRQYRFPRDILDICVNADVDLLANAGQLLSLESILGALEISTNVHLCLCLKDLNIYLKTDDNIRALVGLLGPDTIGALVRGVINTSPDAQQCMFPPHAHHTCNGKDPCHWACDDHYRRDGNTCVCAPPYVSCNGACGLFPSGCSSAIPRLLRTRGSQPILALSHAQAFCKPHESVCGIDDDEGLAFECIDTESTKDSCGGCMAHHPFREVEPVYRAYGQDCTRIINAHIVSCAQSSCIVHSCKIGWIPNSRRDACVADPSIAFGIRPGSKRSDVVSAHGTVHSDVLTRLIAILDTVLNLDAYTPLLETPSVSPTTSNIWPLLDDIHAATAGLIRSPTIGALLRNIDQLLDATTLLKSSLATCGCINELNLSKFVHELDVLVPALADLRIWCSHHQIASNPASGTTVSTSPAAAPSGKLIIIPISSLLAGLDQKGKSVVTTTGLLNGGAGGSSKNLLDALGLSTRPAAASSKPSDLLAKVAVLIQVVVKLEEDSASLPPVSSQHGTSISGDLLVPLANATTNVLTSTTVSSLAVSLHSVVGLSVASLQGLDRCGCVEKLGLKHIYQDLKSLLEVAVDAQSWCLNQLITEGKPVGALDGDIPIVVDLPDLLIKTTTTLGPHNVKRELTALTTLDSDILGQVEALVKLVIDLQILITSSKGDPCFSALNTGHFMRDMANALLCIDPSSTTPAVIAIVDPVLGATRSLQNALQECKGAVWTDELIYLLALIREAAIKLRSMYRPSTTMTERPSVNSTLHASTSLPALTTSKLGIPSIPKTSLSIGVLTLGKSATATTTLPTSPSPISPSSADDEIILALNQLLASLGLGVKGVVTVGGLGHGLSDSVNRILKTVGIGPNGLRRRQTVSGVLSNSTTVTVNLSLGTNVDELIDLVLGLLNACKSSDCGIFPISKILHATVETLKSKTWAKFVDGVNHVATASLEGLRLLDDCECVSSGKLDDVYSYTWRIHEVAVALQELCRELGLGKTDMNGERPIVVGLTRLLNGLGIQGKSAVEITGIGSAELVNTVNQVLDGVGVGPSAERG